MDFTNQPLQFSPKPEAFSYQVDDTPLITFRYDGQVIVSDKMTPDEVGKRVIEIIAKTWPQLIDRAREEGRNEVRERFADFGCEIKDGRLYSYGMKVLYPEDEEPHMQAWQARRKNPE